jgi:hypothetical protein
MGDLSLFARLPHISAAVASAKIAVQWGTAPKAKSRRNHTRNISLAKTIASPVNKTSIQHHLITPHPQRPILPQLLSPSTYFTMPSATPPETERSPSPPASAPTALTPGYRAEAFVTLYKAALDKTLEAISPSSFGACFPSISTNAPTQLAAMHTGMTAGLRSFALAEFDTIMEERRVVENLNRLEDLISDAKKRKARSTSGTDEYEQPVP